VRKESKTSIPTLNLAAGDGDDITQPVGAEHTIDKAVGLTIGKTIALPQAVISQAISSVLVSLLVSMSFAFILIRLMS
jgi:hypothetical protein